MSDRATVRQMLTLAKKAAGDGQIDLLGSGIDAATDLQDVELLEQAARLIDEKLTEDAGGWREATLLYFLGNAWSAIRHTQGVDWESAWTWESEAREQEILAFRRCVVHPGFDSLSLERKAQVFTNIGNVFSNTGRFVEALEFYERALDARPGFGMTLGNKAVCQLSYEREHYDPGQRCVFAGIAAKLLESALRQPLETPDARKGFEHWLEVARRLHCSHDCASKDNLDRFSLGETAEEERFRQWCLKNRLFLNPLNDLGAFSIAGRDFLHLPQMAVKVEYGTWFHGFYNQMKQEYAAARWLFHEALVDEKPAFVDADLNLLDTEDLPMYGLRVEKYRLAMRMSYSIFDKIAVFLAYALDLPDKKRIYFRDVWYGRKRNKSCLLDAFVNRPNLALRALFWLSKDLAGDREDETRQLALEPDARDLVALRNAMEHGYLAVHADTWPKEMLRSGPSEAVRVTHGELRSKSLRVLKLARAALVYLSLAMHREQELRGTPTGLAIPRGPLRPMKIG